MNAASRNQPSSTAAATIKQLAELCQIDPAMISRHHLDLPEKFPLHTGENKRPELCIPLDALIEWALRRTEGLTDIECRLRLAAMTERKRKPTQLTQQTGPWITVLSDDGVRYTLTRDPDDLTPTELERYESQIAAKRADVQMTRISKHARTSKRQSA